MASTQDRDVTHLVELGSIDDELIPVNRCICGHPGGWGNFTISIYRDTPYKCPNCGRGLYFTLGIRVYEVTDSSEGGAG